MTSTDDFDAERSLRSTWSIGPLRPWLRMLAERQLPDALRGRVDPSDIVQQTLLDAWRGRHDFRGTTHAERLAWMRVILTRAIIRQDRDLLKTAKRGQGREKTLQSAFVFIGVMVLVIPLIASPIWPFDGILAVVAGLVLLRLTPVILREASGE